MGPVGSLEKDPQPPPRRWRSSGFRNVDDLAVARPDSEAAGELRALPRGQASTAPPPPPAAGTRRPPGPPPPPRPALHAQRPRVALRTEPWAGFLYVVRAAERWGWGEGVGGVVAEEGTRPRGGRGDRGPGGRCRWAGGGVKRLGDTERGGSLGGEAGGRREWEEGARRAPGRVEPGAWTCARAHLDLASPPASEDFEVSHVGSKCFPRPPCFSSPGNVSQVPGFVNRQDGWYSGEASRGHL